MTMTGETLGQTKIVIKKDEGGKSFIDYKAAYNDVAVFHTYGLCDGSFWLDTWNAPATSEVIRLDSAAVNITSNHADNNYYFRFKYENGALKALKGLAGTESRTMIYDNGFKAGTGNNVSVFKRVAVEDDEEPDDPQPGNPNRGDGVNTPYARLLTLSDYQKWLSGYTGDDWTFLKSQLRGIVKGAYDAGVRPDYMLFGGDFSCMSDNRSASEEGAKQVMEILGETWPNITAQTSVLIQGNHDPASMDGLSETGAYEFEDFIIYVISEDDFPTKQGTTDVLPGIRKTANDLKTWLENKVKEGEKRPIFIASHTSLHYDIDRTDGNNQYAYIMFDAINDAAKALDVTFFFGHNHTNGDEQVGGSLTFYQKGQKLNVCTEKSIANRSGTPTTLNFVYMNYGYVGYIGDITNNPSEFTPTDVLTVSELSIYKDRIEVKRYSKDGLLDSYTGTIDRTFGAETAVIPEQYTVTYDGDGGMIPVESEKVYAGVYVINRSEPSKEGYIFNGYSDGINVYKPGDEITVDRDVVLKAQWVKLPDGQKYILTDTLLPGKQYILVYNSEISGNAGIKYAMTAAGEKVSVTKLDQDSFLASDSILYFEQNADTKDYVWDIVWNQGENAARGFVLQNLGNKLFLCNAGTALTMAKDPLGSATNSNYSSTTFPAFTWLYRGYNGYNQLAMYSDSAGFIRYSVGAGALKLGTTGTSTDVNNSNVFLYEKVEDDAYTWKKVDSLESNEEYLIVNTEKTGDAYAMTTSGSTIGSTGVKVKKDAAGRAYIEYEADYNNVAVYHTYELSDGSFWLDSWNAPSDRQVIRLDTSALKVTSNHADYRYYFRYQYKNGVLSAKEGLVGTAERKLTYNNGFKVDSGTDVALFKRVYEYEAAEEQKAYEAAGVIAENEAAAEEVSAKIKKIGKVAYTEECEALIEEAKSAYESLTDDQKKLVDTDVLKVLEDAGARYEELKQAKAEADAAIGLIEKIGDVTFSGESEEAIKTAREAYEALSADAKAFVPENQTETLQNAAAAYAALKEEAEKKTEEAEKKTEEAEKKTEEAEKKTEEAEKKTEEAEKKTEEAEKKTEEGKKTEESPKPQPTDETKTPEQQAAGAKKGTIFTVGNISYQVTDDNAGAPEVSVKKAVDRKAKKVTVPSKVNSGGIDYKVTSVADNALKGCKNMTSVSLPAGITIIGKNSFAGCTSLKKIVIPANVKEIGASAFKGDKNLKTVTIKSVVLKKVGKNAFKGISSKASVKVPKKQKKAYQKLLKKKGQAATVKIK